MTSGPSIYYLGTTKFNHLTDGFGRFSTFNFKNKKVNFTSKMLNSKYYTESLNNGFIKPGLLYAETTPPRWHGKVPIVNAAFGTTDNNWIDLELLADRKTFVATADSPIKLQMDIKTLR